MKSWQILKHPRGPHCANIMHLASRSYRTPPRRSLSKWGSLSAGTLHLSLVLPRLSRLSLLAALFIGLDPGDVKLADTIDAG